MKHPNDTEIYDSQSKEKTLSQSDQDYWSEPGPKQHLADRSVSET